MFRTLDGITAVPKPYVYSDAFLMSNTIIDVIMNHSLNNHLNHYLLIHLPFKRRYKLNECLTRKRKVT